MKLLVSLAVVLHRYESNVNERYQMLEHTRTLSRASFITQFVKIGRGVKLEIFRKKWGEIPKLLSLNPRTDFHRSYVKMSIAMW